LGEVKDALQIQIEIINKILPEEIFISPVCSIVPLLCRDAALRWNTRYKAEAA
jgi:hypothetical protein